MKKRLLMIITLLLCLLSPVENAPPLTAGAQSAAPIKFQGFLGTYHPYNGTAYGAGGWTEGELLQKAFAFGENAIISQARYNGYTFAENVENNCRQWDVSKLYGILRPPTEKGVINQPEDLDLLKPIQIEPGMIQGARRFSEISKRCPQLSGVIIDDFYNDYPRLLTAENLRDIKAALLGKRVDEAGRVDQSSPTTTPHLKLYIVVYEHQLDKIVDKEVLDAVDGVSFWVWKQSENHKNFDGYIETIRRNYPNKEIIAGVYIFNSRQTPTPASIHYIIERAVERYAQGQVNGLLIFSAIWLSREKMTRERWDELALPQLLARAYYAFLGEGKGRVIAEKTGAPVANALVTVTRLVGGKPLLVARKLTDERGAYRFGGWAGKDKGADYEIRIESGSFNPRSMRLRLRAGASVSFADARLKQ